MFFSGGFGGGYAFRTVQTGGRIQCTAGEGQASAFSLSAAGHTYLLETSLWYLHVALIPQSQQWYVYLTPSLWHPLLPHSLVPSLRKFYIDKAHVIQLDLLG